jgi:hypothetical protein
MEQEMIPESTGRTEFPDHITVPVNAREWGLLSNGIGRIRGGNFSHRSRMDYTKDFYQPIEDATTISSILNRINRAFIDVFGNRERHADMNPTPIMGKTAMWMLTMADQAIDTEALAAGGKTLLRIEVEQHPFQRLDP